MNTYSKSTGWLSVVCCAIFSISVSASDLPGYFLTDLTKAKQEAATKSKKVLVVFSTSWCSPCQAMVKRIYPLAKVENGLAGYVCIYVDGDKDHTHVNEYNIQGYPTFVILDKNARELGRFTGGKQGADAFLKAVDNAVDGVARHKAKAALLDAKIKSAPTLAGYLERAEFREANDNYDGTLADYKKAAKLDTDNKHQIQGDILFLNSALNEDQSAKAMKEQMAAFEKVVKVYPKCKHTPEALLELIAMHGELKNTKKATALAAVFLKDYPNHQAAELVPFYLLMLKLKPQKPNSKDMKPSTTTPIDNAGKIEKMPAERDLSSPFE